MSSHIVPVRTNVTIFVILLALLVATVGASYLPLGPLHLPTALLIATAKAVLIGLFFMHIYYRDRMAWVVAITSLFFLGLLLAFVLGDYLSRGWLDIPGK